MSKNLTGKGRRNFLFGLGAVAGAGVWALADVFKQPLKNKWQSLVAESRDFTIKGNAALKERAAAKGLIYGAAAWQQYLAKDIDYAKSFGRECAILVPEGNLKWEDLRPTPDSFDFTRGDWLLEFARKNNMLFRGHTLLWHYSNPPWFNQVINRQNAEKMLLQHIETVVKHYEGKVHSWDVVNEAIRIPDGRADGLRKSSWLEWLGPDYIDLAFRAAAKADPKALLVYNDNGLEYDNPDYDAKRAAILRLLEGLKSKGTPIDVFGIQAHLDGSARHFNQKKYSKFLNDVASLGLKIMITELDVEDNKLPKDIAIRDRMVAAAYEDYLSVVLEQPAVIGVLTWGLSDRYTWLSNYRPRPDKAPVRSLPLDANLERKLAWNAIARAFDSAPKR